MATVKHAAPIARKRTILRQTGHQAAQTESAAVVRRTRVAPRFANNPAINSDLTKQLQLIANADTEIAVLMQHRAAAVAELESMMESNRIKQHAGAGYTATIEDVFTKASTVVDPQKLFEMFDEQDATENYFECVKVSMDGLKKYFTAGEIAKIGKITPSKKTGTKLVVGPLKVKK